MKQGGQGQMEGCRRCDGNRNGLLGMEGIVEDGGAGWTCWRSISDWYLTMLQHHSSSKYHHQGWTGHCGKVHVG